MGRLSIVCRFTVALVAVPGVTLVVASVTAETPPTQTLESSHRALPPKAMERVAGEVPSPVDTSLHAAKWAALDRPGDARTQAELALLLIQKAREVGNAAYHKLAEESARKALALEPGTLRGRASLAIALSGQHRFRESLEVARCLPEENVTRLSCEVDSLLELGRYDEALAAAQALVDLKPGLEAYPRVALIRELHGDLEGAREMWRLTIGVAHDKGVNAAWAWAQLGDLELRVGDTASAEVAYERSLATLPGFFMARMGRARCSIARDDLVRAEALLSALVEDHGDVAIHALLGDVRMALGRELEATRAFADAVRADSRSTAAGVSDRIAMARFLADHDRELPRALELARQAFTDAPTVVAEDTYAWALLRSGKVGEAKEHMDHARRFGTKTPSVLFHAGAIEIARGATVAGCALLREALENGLRCDPNERVAAERLLARFGR